MPPSSILDRYEPLTEPQLDLREAPEFVAQEFFEIPASGCTWNKLLLVQNCFLLKNSGGFPVPQK